MSASFYWHDYETWGADARRDRAAQFAGIRTDLEFNIIGKPLVVYARPSEDILPQPEACMVTGLTPQLCLEQGAPEAEFFRFIEEEFSQPGTCALGYNTLRFDDEFTRYGFYRNFFDPYAREWKNGNSRWDLIDVVRLTHALRPEGIEWPEREPGVPSFRLELLTAANGIEHQGAHDALADVLATIAMAKLVRDRQPKLFDYVLGHKDKHHLRKVLDPMRGQPVVHVSSRYPARQGCIATVLPLAWHPSNNNGVVVYDLRVDPQSLLELSAQQIRDRLYTPTDQLADGEQRIPLKVVHVNRAPVVVPMNTLNDAVREKWDMGKAREQNHLDCLRKAPELAAKVAEVFNDKPFPPTADPDQDLYGGFLSDADRQLCDRVRSTPPQRLAELASNFKDPRLPELLFRYRARNWPETLDREERARWDAFRRDRVSRQDGGSSIQLDEYRRQLSRLAVDAELPAERRAVVDALIDWPGQIGL